MLKRYRASASYGSLNNRCLPYTSAITDNSKFNLGMIADIYIKNNKETAENHTVLNALKHRKTKEGKKDDKKEDNSKSKKQTCQSAECSTCGV